jgi:hypothetical protein
MFSHAIRLIYVYLNLFSTYIWFILNAIRKNEKILCLYENIKMRTYILIHTISKIRFPLNENLLFNFFNLKFTASHL